MIAAIHLLSCKSMNKIQDATDRAIRLLARWARGSEAYWNQSEDGSGSGCFGPGYRHWGIQANFNYAAALATAAAHSATEDSVRWRQRALAALRYVLATHTTGSRVAADGKRWGNTWISMLGIERAMHGLPHLEDVLTPADRESFRRTLTSEANWLLNPCRGSCAGVAAGLWGDEGRNHPESNIWSGCFHWRAATLYPEEKNADRWREQSHRFLINGVSVEADESDESFVAGRKVSDWHVGANFFPNYALDHHGYLNVGYMAICASNAALLHFDMKQAGLPAPESLYRHQADLWQVLRRFIFPDGRLARIGGDSRVRYAYGQEYLLPALLFAADRQRDPHALDLAARQVALMEAEASAEDGLFYSQRLDWLRRTNPHYYTRLESDRACVLAMLLNFLPLVHSPPPAKESFEASVAGTWIEPSYGAVMHRSPKRLASFAWRAHGLSQALCLPPDDSSLAEWTLNLCPVTRCLGDEGSGRHRRLLEQTVQSFDGGFVVCGSVMEGVNVSIDEGAACTDQAVTHLAFAALPDGQTCLGLQVVAAATDRVVYLAEFKDLHCVVPNDLFNGCQRMLHTACGPTTLTSPPAADEILEFDSRWVNVDDRLGFLALHGADRIRVARSARRRAGRYRSLFTEEVCLHARDGIVRCRPGEILSDIGFAVLSGTTARITANVQGGTIPLAGHALRGIWVEGADNKRYALLANFSSTEQTAPLCGENIRLLAGTATVREMATVHRRYP